MGICSLFVSKHVFRLCICMHLCIVYILGNVQYEDLVYFETMNHAIIWFMLPFYWLVYLYIYIQLEVWEMKPASKTDEASPNWRWPGDRCVSPCPFGLKAWRNTLEHSSNEKAGWVAGGKPFSMADWAPSFSNASRLRCFLCLDVCASGNPRFSDFPSGCWWGFPTKLALFDAQFSLVGKNSHLFTPSSWWRLMIWALCFLDVDSFVRIFEHQPATILFSDRESSKA